jgi:hypothetical protein
VLTRLAERGLLAVSFDPPGHGRRGDGSLPERIAGEVLASFRQRMWPLLGQTVLERDPRAADHIDVKLYDGLSHLDGASSDQLTAGALDWLAGPR